MVQALVVFLALVLVCAVPTFKKVLPWCRDEPGRRPWIIAGGTAVLVVVGVLVPKAFELKPPWSESPSGLFLIIFRVAVLTIVASTALGAIVAAAWSSGHPHQNESA